MNLPNKLTVLRVAMIPVFLFFYFASFVPHHMLWALLIFALASYTDMLDGRIARRDGLVTDFGKLMDPLADKLLVMSAMVCFVWSGNVHALVVIIILAREFTVTSIRLVAAGKGTVIAADIWGKIKTVFQMVWICYDLLYIWMVGLLPDARGFLNTLSVIHTVLVVLVVILTVVSGFHYIRNNRQLFSDA